MQKFRTLLEADLEKHRAVESYVEMVKELADAEKYDPDTFMDKLDTESFTEDIETTYKSYPLKVMYKQLPVIVKGEVLVKVVLLLQADSFALVVPENISEIYKDLIDDPTLVRDKNVNFSLYAELYNFDSQDKELLELIKETYLSAGGSMPAFELTGELKNQAEEEKETEEEFDDFGADTPDFSSTGKLDLDTGSDGGMEDMDTDFGDIEEPVEEMPEVQENKDALKKFKKHSKYLESLVSKLSLSANKVFQENTRVKFLNGNKNILVVEVDNRNIFKKYKHVPKIAKRSLSTFGEMIRKNKHTQLIDAFTNEGKRYFVVAEDTGSNFWYVNEEPLNSLKENNKDVIRPIQEDLIKLKRSSVRKEARDYTPYKEGKEILFLKK